MNTTLYSTSKRLGIFLAQYFLLLCIVLLALGINYLYAWTGPTVPAPNGNVSAPLNVSTTNQVKLASLSVGKAVPVATDYGLISYGRVRSTIGGIEFPDGTVQATAGRPMNVKVPNTLSFDSYLHVRDSKPAGANGIYIAGGAWQEREYTTVLDNTITGALLSSNKITLPAGVYCLVGWAAAYGADEHRSIFRNVTDSTDVLIGESAFSESGGDGNDQSNSVLTGRFTISKTTVFAVWHRCAVACYLGNANGWTTENHSDIEIWKLD